MKRGFGMGDYQNYSNHDGYSKHDSYSKHDGYSKYPSHSKKDNNCEVRAKEQIPLADATTPLVLGGARLSAFKIPVILAEREIQIVVE